MLINQHKFKSRLLLGVYSGIYCMVDSEWHHEKTFTLSSGDYEFESWELSENNWPCSLGAREGIIPLPCQSQQHQPTVGICKLMYAEKLSLSSEGVMLPCDAAGAPVS